MISVALKNPPSDAYYWRPILFANEVPYYPPNYLLLSERWDLATTGSGYMRLRVVTLRSDMSSLAIRELYNVYIEDEHNYAYNWATNEWEDITVLPWWQIIGGDTTLLIGLSGLGEWRIIGADTTLLIGFAGPSGWQIIGADIPLYISLYEEEPPTVCYTDADCPEGYICQNGKCVPKEKEKDWILPVALIGGGVALAAVAAKGKTKKT